MENSSYSLKQYSAIYELLLDTLLTNQSTVNIEGAVSIIKSLANFAWQYHPGLFVDIRLESWALQLGNSIWQSQKGDVSSTVVRYSVESQKVLHVVTETYEVGGHTRLLLNLIKGDATSSHSLVLTRQSVNDVPRWLIEAVEATGGVITSLASESCSAQIAILQQYLTTKAERIFYHIHPDDVVAVAALAAIPRPPVMFINHADHVFWLGASLADVIVCIRDWSEKFSLAHRNAQKVALLPIPLSFAPLDKDFKANARKQLGIAEDSIVVLSVASFYKFIPSGQYNYFETINEILEANDSVYVKIIGISVNDELAKLQYIHHDRIELLGILNEPQIYYKAADIYLDSMPFSSFTSLFEAMYFKCFPVLQYSPVSTLNIDEEPVYKGLVSHANNALEQLNLIQKAIDNSAYRKDIAIQCSNRVKEYYMMPGWSVFLNNIYKDFSLNITVLRDLSICFNKNKVNIQDDIDAANLAASFHKLDSEILLGRIRAVVRFISFEDILTIYKGIKRKKHVIGFSFSMRQITWLIRMKVKDCIY